MAKDDLFFRIRLPAALKSDIQRLALANHRSANAEIVARLNESIALNLSGLAPDAGYKSVDEIDEGHNTVDEMLRLEGKKREMLIVGLQEVLGLLTAKGAPAPAGDNPAKKGGRAKK
jgi:hypothetical protein